MTSTATRWLMTASNPPFVAQSIDLPAPQAGEVLVRVAGCGVCHTDLGFYYDGVRTKHALPLTLGHEISGHVVATGEGAFHARAFGNWDCSADLYPGALDLVLSGCVQVASFVRKRPLDDIGVTDRIRNVAGPQWMQFRAQIKCK